MAPKKGYSKPIPTSELEPGDRELLIESGWRVFVEGGIEYIVPMRRHRPPTIDMLNQNQKFMDKYSLGQKLPRATFGLEKNGRKIELIAWDYKQITVDDIDDIVDSPKSLKGLKGVFGYIWTDSGLHIYRKGKHQILPESDTDYERISRENRGWYGDRIRNRDELSARTLVTTDEESAIAWAKAGGLVRLVKDLGRSYIASRASKKRINSWRWI